MIKCCTEQKNYETVCFVPWALVCACAVTETHSWDSGMTKTVSIKCQILWTRWKFKYKIYWRRWIPARATIRSISYWERPEHREISLIASHVSLCVCPWVKKKSLNNQVYCLFICILFFWGIIVHCLFFLLSHSYFSYCVLKLFSIITGREQMSWSGPFIVQWTWRVVINKCSLILKKCTWKV